MFFDQYDLMNDLDVFWNSQNMEKKIFIDWFKSTKKKTKLIDVASGTGDIAKTIT